MENLCVTERVRKYVTTDKQSVLVSEKVSVSLLKPRQEQKKLVKQSQDATGSRINSQQSSSKSSQSLADGDHLDTVSNTLEIMLVAVAIAGLFAYMFKKNANMMEKSRRKKRKHQSNIKHIQRRQQNNNQVESQEDDKTDSIIYFIKSYFYVTEKQDNSSNEEDDANPNYTEDNGIDEITNAASSSSSATNSPIPRKHRSKKKQNNTNPAPNAEINSEEIGEPQLHIPIPDFILNQNLNCELNYNQANDDDKVPSPKKSHKRIKKSKKNQTNSFIPGLSTRNNSHLSSDNANNNCLEFINLDCESSVKEGVNDDAKKYSSNTITFVPGTKSSVLQPNEETHLSTSNEDQTVRYADVSPFATIMASKFATYSLMEVDCAVKEVLEVNNPENLTPLILEKMIRFKMFKVGDLRDDEIYMSDDEVEDCDDEASTNTDTDDDNECLICLELLKDEFAYLKCSHAYHQHCIKDWMNKDESCPKCRTEI